MTTLELFRFLSVLDTDVPVFVVVVVVVVGGGGGAADDVVVSGIIQSYSGLFHLFW